MSKPYPFPDYDPPFRERVTYFEYVGYTWLERYTTWLIISLVLLLVSKLIVRSWNIATGRVIQNKMLRVGVKLWDYLITLSLVSSAHMFLLVFSMYFSTSVSLIMLGATITWFSILAHMLRIDYEESLMMKNDSDSDRYYMMERDERTIGQRLYDYILGYPRRVLEGVVLRRAIALVVALLALLFIGVTALPSCYICMPFNPTRITTAFTRKFLNPNRQCQWNSICFMYFTVPRDMSTSMIVNFQTYSSSPLVSQVLFREDGSSDSFRIVTATHFLMDVIPDQTRYQYWADLEGLKPDTVYEVIAEVYPVRGESERIISSRRFRTAPSLTSPDQIVFVEGGDLEWSNAGIELSKAVSKVEPHFAIVGGDIAYENGIGACYERMDEWFRKWDLYTTTPKNYSVPILTAIGNHEAGGFRQTRDKSAFYFRYFPHEIGLKGLDPNSRRAYHEHVFANHMHLTILDSYTVTPILGQQTTWLESMLEQQMKPELVNRFAVYHAAAYPTYEDSEVPDIAYHIRHTWLPIFEKNNFTVVFENHYHIYWESLRIRNGTLDEENGIYLLGQGAWGTSGSLFDYRPQPGIERLFANENHVFVTKCDPKKCLIDAIKYDRETESIQPLSHLTIKTERSSS